MKQQLYTFSDTTPAAPGTALSTHVCGIPSHATAVSFYANLIGATGGTLDVYIQTRINSPTPQWWDWAHFPQLGAGAAAIRYIGHQARSNTATTITVVGAPVNDDGTIPTPALAANTVVAGAWGEAFRLVYVAGAATSAGAVISVSMQIWSPR